jgi:predicted ATPase
MNLSTGTLLGHYRIDLPLGAGGMGEVYRATDTRLDRPVAIKLLTAEIAAGPDGLRRFHLEARAASSLNHPHILVVHDVGDAGGRPFLVTELVEGRTLRQRLEEGPLSVREAIDLGLQMLGALAAAHARGIVHRDIKPENIMVRPDGYVKVLDFGLAKLAVPDDGGAQTELHTTPGLVVGTPGYMAPEQIAGEVVDFRADQFAFGVLMYELLAGRPPFRRSSALLSAAAVVTETPEPLARLRPDLPPPLWWAIERCLAKQMEARYADTGELHRELATIRGRLSDVRPPAPPVVATNLPASTTSLVGRETDAHAVRTLLTKDEVRWVTLTGPGGVGKTRLALHVAREMSEAFAGATYFIPLAGVSDADQLLATLARTLEVRVGAGEPPLPALIRHVRALQAALLLVLDNFEHVAAAAVQVALLVEGCEAVKVLATSRARLNISAEQEFEVSPLPLPDARVAARARAVADVPAVQLFVERARAARSGFELTDHNAEAVAEICRALDGLPLAIELAAARVKLLPPESLRTRIAGRSLSLDGGARDRPERQQTLRAAIDWSYELLSQEEQRLFRRLGVFVGGWTIEAAEAVCGAREDLGLDVFDGLSSLVDKSLVRMRATSSGEPRFFMLATIREYALERLELEGEAADTRRALAAYGLVLAEEPAPDAAAQAAWLALCEVEHRNLRAAIDHLVESGQSEWAIRLTSALLPFWQAGARLREGRDALSRALAIAAEDSTTRARALFALGTIADSMGELPHAETLMNQALAIFRASDDGPGQGVVLNALGVVYHRMERFEDARRSLSEAVGVWRGLGREQAALRSLANLASVAFDAGDTVQAAELYRETRAQCESAGDAAGAAWAVSGEARVEHFRQDYAAARALYEEALARFERVQDNWGVGDSLLALGVIAGERGEPDVSIDRLARARDICRDVGDIRGMVRLIEAFAYLAAHAGQAEHALALAGAAAAQRRALGTPLPAQQQARLDAALDEARRQVDPARAGAAWMQGWSLSADEAVALAFAGAGHD